MVWSVFVTPGNGDSRTGELTLTLKAQSDAGHTGILPALISSVSVHNLFHLNIAATAWMNKCVGLKQ